MEQLRFGDQAVGASTPDEAAQREADLRERLRGARLVMEAGLDSRLLEHLRSLLDRLDARRVPVEAIARRYPAVFVTYLVAEGLFSYRDGNFWSHVLPRIRGENGSAAGRAFEEALVRLGLERFDRLFPAGVAYSRVNKILAHGGIPTHCLDGFFSLVEGEVERGVSDATEMLATWRQSSWRLNTVTQPVERFLLHGGRLAVDFLTRCIDLILDWPAGGRPSPDDVGLPAYVVEAFARLPRTGRRASRRGVVGVPRPAVLFDPWSHLGPVLELPVVPSSADYPTWNVDDGRGIVTVEGSPFSPERVPLAPARIWECEYACADGSRRRFVFEGLSEVAALLFDPSTGRLLREPSILTRGTVWMVRRQEERLTVVRDGKKSDPRVTEHFPPLKGTWSGFEAFEVSLEDGEILEIGEPPGGIQVAVSSRPCPELDGRRVPGVLTETGEPVYATPPSLVIPDVGATWHGVIRARGEVTSLDSRVLRPGRIDLAPYVDDGIQAVHVSLRGPLGSDATFSFCVVPGLTCALPTRLLTKHDGQVTVPVTAGPGIALDPPQPVVEADADRARVTARDGRGWLLELVVQVPRLLWGVASQRAEGRKLGTELVHLDLGDLRDGTPTILDVRTGLPGTRMRLRLTAPRRGTLHESKWIAAPQGRWGFDLDEFGDTATLSGEHMLVVVLEAGDVKTPAVRVAAQYEVWGLRVDDAGVSDAGGFVQVSFSENTAFKGRVVRAWSRWRPWETAVVQPVPDGETGRGRLESPHLLPGEYFVEVAVGDAWEAPRRPSRPSRRVASICLGSAEAIARHLDALPSDDPLAAVEAARADGRRLPGLGTLDEDAVDAACLAGLDAVAATPNGSPTGPSLRTLVGLLVEKPRPTLRAVARLIERQRVHRREMTRLALRMVAELRAEMPDPVEDSSMRLLWSGAPILAAVADLPAACAGGEEANVRCDRFMGWSPRQQGEPPPVKRIDSTLLGRPPEKIEELIAFLGSLPQLILDVGIYGPANLAWLLRQLRANGAGGRLRPAEWFESHAWLIGRPIGEAECGLSARLRRDLAGRAADACDPPWAAIPQLTLAAAAHLTAGTASSSEALRALDEAVQFCRTLVECDVVRAIAYDELPLPPDPGR